MKEAFNIFLLIILFIGNKLINESNYYFLLIYVFISLYYVYIYIILFKNKENQKYDLKIFLFISIFLYLFTYFIICDPNPFFCLLSFYSFYPNFFKAIFIMVIHSYAPYYYINNYQGNFINQKRKEDLSIKFTPQTKGNIEYYFFSFL